MKMVAGRLSTENAEWLPHFLERTGATKTKVINESMRIAKETLERRLSSGEILFPCPKDPPKGPGA